MAAFSAKKGVDYGVTYYDFKVLNNPAGIEVRPGETIHEALLWKRRVVDRVLPPDLTKRLRSATKKETVQDEDGHHATREEGADREIFLEDELAPTEAKAKGTAAAANAPAGGKQDATRGQGNKVIDPPWEIPYQPLRLGQIRLLVLQPGDMTDALVGDFQVADLTSNGCDRNYEALSYYWGRPGLEEAICLNGVYQRIFPNLAHALRHLRRASTVRTLWVDAICINQCDIQEKNEQVPKMLDIYGAATGVHAWLGPASKHSAQGMMILEHLLSPTMGIPSAQPWTTLLPPEFIREGLRDIVNRPYFSRLWVVQEAAVGREILFVCGHHHFGWLNKMEVVYPLLRRLKAAMLSPQWRVNGLDHIRLDLIADLLQMQLNAGPDADKWKKSMPKLDLLDLAYSVRDRKSTDPRDMLYALSGLAGDGQSRAFKPDYRLPLQDVQRQFEEAYLADWDNSPPAKRRSIAVASEPETTGSGQCLLESTQFPNSARTLKQGSHNHDAPSASMVCSVCEAENVQWETHILDWEKQKNGMLEVVETALQETKALIQHGDLGVAADSLRELAYRIESCTVGLEKSRPRSTRSQAWSMLDSLKSGLKTRKV